jgi:membrane protease YdiL (CAAX protease family)
MLSLILILVLTAFSLRVWAHVVLRWKRGLPALEAVPRVRSPWLPVACGAAGVLAGMMLFWSLWVLFDPPQQVPEASLSDLQRSVADGALQIIIALALLTGAGRVPLVECGITTDRPSRQLRDGVNGYLASIVPVTLMLLLTYVLRTPENQHPYLKLLQEDREVAAWLLVTAVVVAPIKEELIFRVMLQDGLARRIGAPAAIVGTSIVFCLVHGFPDSLALFPLALILGYVYDRRQSAVAVILIHALFNLTNIVILLLDSKLPEQVVQ